MGIRYDYASMVRELHDLGFDAAQTARYDAAYGAAKLAAATLVCAMHGLRPEELPAAVDADDNLTAEYCLMVARMEASPAFIAHIHSNFRF
ncbi:MAG: hypothetical protein KGL18_01680 [Burkholderiales bacterium]|nr:hypothetical protein [Burkholderiales bacterium]MDE1928675.1 hypothetical protein [Burkholderiales bacterium]MDE2501676.1 hypothetical protein [Burkholderiales bacterium]